MRTNEQWWPMKQVMWIKYGTNCNKTVHTVVENLLGSVHLTLSSGRALTYQWATPMFQMLHWPLAPFSVNSLPRHIYLQQESHKTCTRCDDLYMYVVRTQTMTMALLSSIQVYQTSLTGKSVHSKNWSFWVGTKVDQIWSVGNNQDRVFSEVHTHLTLHKHVQLCSTYSCRERD